MQYNLNQEREWAAAYLKHHLSRDPTKDEIQAQLDKQDKELKEGLRTRERLYTKGLLKANALGLAITLPPLYGAMKFATYLGTSGYVVSSHLFLLLATIVLFFVYLLTGPFLVSESHVCDSPSGPPEDAHWYNFWGGYWTLPSIKKRMEEIEKLPVCEKCHTKHEPDEGCGYRVVGMDYKVVE